MTHFRSSLPRRPAGSDVVRLPRYDRLPRRTPLVAAPWMAKPVLDGDTLTLITLQTPGAYEVLQRDGVLHGDPVLGDPDFAEGYSWMARQMKERLPTSGDGMLWLWARTRRRDLLDDLRHARGDVLLTVRVPRERALLSDFCDWHQVLNHAINVAPLPGESDEQWEARFDIERGAWDERTRPYDGVPFDEWPHDLRAETEASWDAIFDLNLVPPHRPIQATVHELRAQDVVRAVRTV